MNTSDEALSWDGGAVRAIWKPSSRRQRGAPAWRDKQAAEGTETLAWRDAETVLQKLPWTVS